ncbi:MAG: ferrous iron transport protein B [Planctomycetia bacterium]|nr:ferrous iron transport protein B [Planctomycetia bacterium]
MSATKQVYRIALAGNPNCGKTTLFNYLTGEKRAVGNYSGVTVETVSGRVRANDADYELVDLPGVYSLTTFSKDEIEARDYLVEERPDLIVNVVDASNFERNLFLTLQLLELGLPTIIALNMCDLARNRGISIDISKLSDLLGVPVIETVGSTGQGVSSVLDQSRRVLTSLESTSSKSNALSHLQYSASIEQEIASVEAVLSRVASEEYVAHGGFSGLSECSAGVRWLLTGAIRSERVESFNWDGQDVYSALKSNARMQARRRWTAIKLLEDDPHVTPNWSDESLSNAVSSSTSRLVTGSAPMAALLAAERYKKVRDLSAATISNDVHRRRGLELSDSADRVLTHPFWGLLIFFAAMYLVFWLTFTVGAYPVSWLESLQDYAAELCNRLWADNPESLARSIIVDGIIGGVGAVLVFFPNIFILFAAITILEESGYMARGAFLTDRFMSRVGLTGKSFIPLLVGFGCSVPAIMSTRIIEDRKTRFQTIFIAPLMSCGARYPIYMLLIPAFFPQRWQAPVLWLIYVLGIVVAAVISTVLSKTMYRGEISPLLIELPPYHRPTLRTVGYRAFERGWQYLRKFATTILAISLLLWALSTFPRLPQDVVASYDAQQSALETEASELGVDLQEYMESTQESQEKATATEFASEEQSLEAMESGADETQLEEDAAVAERLSELSEEWTKLAVEHEDKALEHSIAGRIGHSFAPVIRLAGWDWRIGTGLIGALAAKEVFVAQMGIVYRVANADEESESLQEILSRDYSRLVCVSLLVFCLIGAPCMATLVTVAKELSWRWAFIQWFSLTALGFILSVAIYQFGLALHLGL